METSVSPFEEFRARDRFRNALTDPGPDDAVMIRKFFQRVREDVPDLGAALHLLKNVQCTSKT